MKKGMVDIPIVFVGLLILTVVILLVLSLFGFNLVDKIQELVMGSLQGLASFFADIFSFGG